MSIELPENVKTWIAALRSGAYRQTRESLRDDYGYCCLGVACDLFPYGEWDKEEQYEFVDFSMQEYDESHRQNGALTDGVRERLGLESSCGTFSVARLKNPEVIPPCVKGSIISLVVLNDELEWDFDQIADFIEQEYEALAKFPF